MRFVFMLLLGYFTAGHILKASSHLLLEFCDICIMYTLYMYT